MNKHQAKIKTKQLMKLIDSNDIDIQERYYRQLTKTAKKQKYKRPKYRGEQDD